MPKQNQEHQDWQSVLAALKGGMPIEEPADNQEGIPAEEVSGIHAIPPQRFVVAIQRKGRAGKTVTLISSSEEGLLLPELLVYLKQRCGCGGTMREEKIELQGDKRKQAQAILTELGHSVQLGN